MTDIMNLGLSARSKRKAKNWSQEYLAEKAGVSVGAVGNFENGKKIREDLQEKIMLHLGMIEALTIVRKDRSITGYKSLSLEELRTSLQICKDYIREGNDKQKVEFATYKSFLQKEIEERMRALFSI